MSTSPPRRLAIGSEGPRGRAAVLGDKGQSPRAGGVNQLSRGPQARVPSPAVSTMCPWCRPAFPGDSGPCMRARVRGPAGSTSSPRCPRPGCQVTRFRQVIPGDSGPCLSAHGVDKLSRMTCPWVQGTVVPPPGLGDLGQGPRSHGVNLLPRATRARVLGSAGSTSSPGCPGLGSEFPRF